MSKFQITNSEIQTGISGQSKIFQTMFLTVFLCLVFSSLLYSQEVKPVDVNVDSKPLALKDPFFDMTGKARNFRIYDAHKTYYWDHEFCFELQKENSGDTVFIVSRESTPFTDSWQFGPTYTGVSVDWNSAPMVRVIGVKFVDRMPQTFHDVNIDTSKTYTAFLLFALQDGKWKEWYVNNWFHNWDKETPGLCSPDIAQYYIDMGEPYDVFGHMNAFDERVYSEEVRGVLKKYEGKIFHGLLFSDKDAPLGYRLKLLHWWAAWKYNFGPIPAYGSTETLKRFEQKEEKWHRNN